MGMEQDATRALNDDVSICAVVATRGTGGRVAAFGVAGQAIGALGSMAAEALTSKTERPFGGHKGYMVMAAGKTKLGFFKKKGLVFNGIGDLLGQCQRDQISSFVVAGKGLATSAIDITLSDGSSYELEVPRASKGKAEKVQKVLGF
jgi:hypothetical protein